MSHDAHHGRDVAGPIALRAFSSSANDSVHRAAGPPLFHALGPRTSSNLVSLIIGRHRMQYACRYAARHAAVAAARFRTRDAGITRRAICNWHGLYEKYGVARTESSVSFIDTPYICSKSHRFININKKLLKLKVPVKKYLQYFIYLYIYCVKVNLAILISNVDVLP